jgi:hypothetical protein
VLTFSNVQDIYAEALSITKQRSTQTQDEECIVRTSINREEKTREKQANPCTFEAFTHKVPRVHERLKTVRESRL